MSDERLTWSQIQERYPDQWVGLINVEYEPDNKSTVKSAIVKYINMKKSDLKLIQVKSGGSMIAEYTGQDNTLHIGLMGVFR